MRSMGIDYGAKRVGIALSDPKKQFAMPHKVLDNSPLLLEEIKAVCVDQEVDEIIMGESQDYNRQDNPIMKKILKFKEELHTALNLPIHFEPEVLTTMEAERLQGKNELRDASAAALILKSYLERQRNDHN